MGHASIMTMIHTEQDAVHLGHVLERTAPDAVAVERAM
jgi:hypothetical protein